MELLKKFQQDGNELRVEQLDEAVEAWEDNRVFLWNGKLHQRFELNEWLDERRKIRDRVLSTSEVKPKPLTGFKRQKEIGNKYLRTIRSKDTKSNITVYSTGRRQLRKLKTRRRNRLKKREYALAEVLR